MAHIADWHFILMQSVCQKVTLWHCDEEESDFAFLLLNDSRFPLETLFLLYPHFGQTPFSSNATPQRTSVDRACWQKSADAAFTPLLNVILAMFSLSFNRS